MDKETGYMFEKLFNVMENLEISIKKDIAELKSDVAELKSDMLEVKKDIAELKNDVAELKRDMVELKQDIEEIRDEQKDINIKIDVLSEMWGKHQMEIKDLKKKIS